jgi:hypothetical protein
VSCDDKTGRGGEARSTLTANIGRGARESMKVL